MTDFERYRQEFKETLGNISGWTSTDEKENVGKDDFVTVLQFNHTDEDMSVVCNVHKDTGDLQFILQGGDEDLQTFFDTIHETHDAMKENQ